MNPETRLPEESQLSFTFEGRSIRARSGQTVAGALLANRIDVFTRSFKYRRPRGYTCGYDACGNCPLTVDGLQGVTACTAPVRGGEVVRRERGWPSADLDVMRIIDLFARFVPAGFQFRLFRSKPRLAHRAEKVMARIAGAGRFPTPEAAALRRRRTIVDSTPILVVGGGLSGCAAALAAADSGSEVLLAYRGELGGRSLARTQDVTWRGSAMPANEVASQLAKAVEDHPNIRAVEGTAVSTFETGVIPIITAVDLIETYPRHVIVATGSYDVPALFAGNDKPGVVLADGVSKMLMVERVAPWNRAVLLTDGPRGYEIARQIRAAGIDIAAIADTRSAADIGADPDSSWPAGIVHAGATIDRVIGHQRARRVRVAHEDTQTTYRADLVCVALTERPAQELALQWHYVTAGTTEAVDGGWNGDDLSSPEAGLTVVGSAAGRAVEDLEAASSAGHRAGKLVGDSRGLGS